MHREKQPASGDDLFSLAEYPRSLLHDGRRGWHRLAFGASREGGRSVGAIVSKTHHANETRVRGGDNSASGERLQCAFAIDSLCLRDILKVSKRTDKEHVLICKYSRTNRLTEANRYRLGAGSRV